jgi:hypothetical protein
MYDKNRRKNTGPQCVKKKWLQDSQPSMPFAILVMYAPEQNDHIRACYFCLTNVRGFSAISKHGIQYLNLPSAIWPVPHDGFPIPKPQSDWTIDDESEESFSDDRHGATIGIVCQDLDFSTALKSSHLFTQPGPNNHVRDLNLSQTQSELLAS